MKRDFMIVQLSSLLFVSFAAQAQMDMTFRRNNAIALYEFLDTSGNMIKDTSTLGGSALDLTIADASGAAISRGSGFIELRTRNLISSAAAATKVINACKASGEMSVEVWVENNDPAKPQSGEYPSGTLQPNRIVSLGSNLLKNNFSVGQVYDAAELYSVAMNTTGNENPTNPGGSLNNALMTVPNQIIVPSLETKTPPAVKMQKIVLTLSKDQIARLYLSDRNGYISQAAMTTRGLGRAGTGSYFNNWYTDAKLTLGNVSSTFDAVKNAPSDFTKCIDNNSIAKDPGCAANSRYWKGKIYLVAVYCKALTAENILGDRAKSQLENKVLPIDPNLVITPNLQKAQDIFQRLTGIKTPIYDPTLAQMEDKLDVNDPVGAAAIATNDSRFYNIVVRDFGSKMSNRAETINTPMNDFTATIIGGVRDEVNAQRLLWDNIIYMADPAKAAVATDLVADTLRSNNHYEQLDTQRVDLSKVLKATTQKIFDGSKAVDMPTPAGLLTSRRWLSEHATAGTNRRLVEFSLREFLCTPLENVADSSGPDNVVARDIDRFPGGSHTKYTTSCRACHTIMDGFRPAFAYLTFNAGYVMHSYTSPHVTSVGQEDTGEGIFTSPGATAPGATYVHKKLNHNETVFPGGRITVDDNWVNNANNGANAPYFNWQRLSGKGVSDYGKMLASSKQFPICMAKRIYTQICKREPASSDMAMINSVAEEFSTQRNYNLKFLFQKIVTTKECLGE